MSPSHTYYILLKTVLFTTVFVAIALLMGCTKVQSTEGIKKGSVTPSISVTSQSMLGEAVPITFTLRNETNNTIQFLKWGTPFESNMTRDQFSILHQGKRLNYQGIMVKRARPTKQDYLQLGPKKSIETTIDISNSYNFSKPGKYTVIYNESFLDIKAVKGLNWVKKSNSVTLTLNQ